MQTVTLFTGISGTGTARQFIRALTGGAWTPWREVINQGRLVGTVSQSGGVPTGAVIERGSNANGEYVRFADGTQICTRYMTLPFAAATYLGASWTFPAAFVAASVPVVEVTMDASAWSGMPGGLARGDGQAAVGNVTNLQSVPQWWTRSGAPALVSGNTVGVYVQATGRWF